MEGASIVIILDLLIPVILIDNNNGTQNTNNTNSTKNKSNNSASE